MKWFKPRSVVVVDRRTFRNAKRQYDKLIEAGEDFKARVVATAIMVWLRDQVRYGRKRRRLEYAVELEQWETRALRGAA